MALDGEIKLQAGKIVSKEYIQIFSTMALSRDMKPVLAGVVSVYGECILPSIKNTGGSKKKDSICVSVQL